MDIERIKNLAKKIYEQTGAFKMHTSMAKDEIKIIEKILEDELKSGQNEQSRES